MNVTACKFFLRGACRYGDRCRFFHPPNNEQNYQGGQAGFYGGNASNTVYGQIQESRYKLNENVKAIEEVVKKDMVEWEKCKIWPFSCYGPCAAKPNLDGFEDLSPEELRFATLQNNGVPPTSIALRFQLWNGARAKYQQTTQANLEALESIIIGAPISNSTTTANFGQGNAQINPANLGNPASAFGGKPFASPSFGASANPAAISNFSFSLNKNQVQTESMEETAFAAGSQSAFGMSSPSLSSFSFNQAVAAPIPQQPAAVNSGFPNLTQFHQPQQTTVASFPYSTAQSPQQVGAGNITNQFGGGNFMGGMNTSSFSGPSMFGGQQQQLADPSYAGLQTTGIASLGGAGDGGSTYEKTVYSALSDLTSEEIHAFESPQFDINNLPLRAPAKKFCF